MTLKTAMVAPMPRASVMSVTRVNMGARIRRRRTCFSCVVSSTVSLLVRARMFPRVMEEYAGYGGWVPAG